MEVLDKDSHVLLIHRYGAAKTTGKGYRTPISAKPNNTPKNAARRPLGATTIHAETPTHYTHNTPLPSNNMYTICVLTRNCTILCNADKGSQDSSPP